MSLKETFLQEKQLTLKSKQLALYYRCQLVRIYAMENDNLLVHKLYRVLWLHFLAECCLAAVILDNQETRLSQFAFHCPYIFDTNLTLVFPHKVKAQNAIYLYHLIAFTTVRNVTFDNYKKNHHATYQRFRLAFHNFTIYKSVWLFKNNKLLWLFNFYIIKILL